MNLVRFTRIPAQLRWAFDYYPFEIRHGRVSSGNGPLLVGVWRRKGSGQPYEPVSAQFVANHIASKMRGSYVLPQTDEDLNTALRQLQVA